MSNINFINYLKKNRIEYIETMKRNEPKSVMDFYKDRNLKARQLVDFHKILENI